MFTGQFGLMVDNKTILDQMQTRDELYRVLRYHEYEQRLDQILEKQKS